MNPEMAYTLALSFRHQIVPNKSSVSPTSPATFAAKRQTILCFCQRDDGQSVGTVNALWLILLLFMVMIAN
jgi:hypothetical protein